MQYWLKRHITNTLLYVVIITGVGAVMTKFSRLYAAVFLFASAIALAFDRHVENGHLKMDDEK